MEIGTIRATDMGTAIAVPWSEISAWSQVTGVSFSPWEAATLWAMSDAYASESSRAKDPAAQAPWAEKQQALLTANLKARWGKNG